MIGSVQMTLATRGTAALTEMLVRSCGPF